MRERYFAELADHEDNLATLQDVFRRSYNLGIGGSGLETYRAA
jgi:hypothetical protein